MSGSTDELHTPLEDVTFVVLDLETTGGSPSGCAITEIGALKFRGGECLGTFETDVALPWSVAPVATPLESALPSLLEFIGGAVVVGHNVSFDIAFLQANLARLGYPALTNIAVDTYRLARRLVRDDVLNLQLGTLARHFRTTTAPCHRAFADAAATAQLFHLLLEQVGSIGIVALDDLVALPAAAAHPQVAKLRWVAPLPRRPGVFLFRGAGREALFAGSAADLRTGVRSLFCSSGRRVLGPMLREAQSLEHLECVHELEAAVVAGRIIDRLGPRCNPEAKDARRQRYAQLAGGRPRIARASGAEPGCGPWPSAGAARLAARFLAAGIDPVAGDVDADHPAVATDADLQHWPPFLEARDRLRRCDALVARGAIDVAFDGGGARVTDGRLSGAWGPADVEWSTATASATAVSWGVTAGSADDARWIVPWLESFGRDVRIAPATAA